MSSYEMGNPHVNFVGRPEDKKLIAKPGHRYKVNQDVGCEEAGYIYLVWREVRCQVVTDTMVICWLS